MLGSSVTKVFGKTSGAITLGLMALLLPACNNNEPVATTPPEATAPAEGTVTAEEVADKTTALIGRNVTVRAELGEKLGPNTFTIENDEFFGNDQVLVVNATGRPIVLPEDDAQVQVTGEVTKLVVAEVEKEFDLDLDRELEVEYEGKPAIIAQAAAPAPDPGDITENPKPYYGRPLAVAGEVEEIYSPTMFTLDEDELFGADDLLVIVANPKANTAALKESEYVATTGVLRSFVVADLERDYDLTWDLEVQKKLEAEYSTKPVLVVDAVYPSATPKAQ